MKIKKAYAKPLLTRVELKAEEAVLTGCKVPGTTGPGYAFRCYNNGGQNPCSDQTS